jgi:hypothetical protein
MARRKPATKTCIGNEPVTHVAVLENATLNGQWLEVINPRAEASAQFNVAEDHLQCVAHYWPNAGWIWV